MVGLMGLRVRRCFIVYLASAFLAIVLALTAVGWLYGRKHMLFMEMHSLQLRHVESVQVGWINFVLSSRTARTPLGSYVEERLELMEAADESWMLVSSRAYRGHGHESGPAHDIYAELLRSPERQREWIDWIQTNPEASHKFWSQYTKRVRDKDMWSVLQLVREVTGAPYAMPGAGKGPGG